MTTPAIVRAAVEAAFREYVVEGLPSSGVHEPIKSEIRAALGATLEAALSSVGSGITSYATVPLMDAVTDASDGSLAYVFNNNDDPADPLNGVYQWDLAATDWVTADWYFNAVAGVVQPFVDQAEAWAVGFEPGGPGTKSSMTWALEAAAHAATIAASLLNISELRTDVASRVAGGVDDVNGNLAFGVDIYSGQLVGGGVDLLLDRIRGGITFETPGENAHPAVAVNMIGGNGQSLINAYGARPILSTSQAHGHLMFNGGLYRPAGAGLTSFVPLVSADDGTHGETIFPALTATVAARVGGAYPMLAVAWGQDDTTLVNLMKGTAPYTGWYNALVAAKSICDAADPPLSIAYQATHHMQGESDEASNVSFALHSSRLTTHIGDVATDAKAVFGQAHDPKYIFDQTSSWTHYGKTIPTIALAQLAVYKADPVNRILVGPKYHLDYPDGVHPSPHSQRRWGCYHGKAYFETVILGRPFAPLMPVTIVRDTPRSIIITHTNPRGRLVLDADWVTDPNGAYGYEIDDEGGAQTLTSVKTLGQADIRITFDRDLGVTAFASYAYTGTADADAGRTTGARGCLRDSDPALPIALAADGLLSLFLDEDGHPYKLYNWCVHYREAIP